MKGLLDQAEKAFEAARSLAAEGSVAQVALAMAWMQNGQNARAIALMREHTRAARTGYLAFYVLGLALMRSGAEPGQPEESEAAAAFEAAVRLKPDHFPSRTELGKLFAKRGDLAQAIAHLEQAVAGDAESVAAAYALAQAYRRSGKPERAAEMLARVDKLNAAQREPGADDELRRTVLRIVRELN